MLRFFPFIYPDELLYSAISRYYKYTGKGSIKLTFKELFGDNAHVFSTIDFPYNIDSFIEQFDIIYHYTSKDIILNFTMLPLYLPFLDSSTQQYAINSMKNANGMDLYKKLGVMASNFKCLNDLKYCPSCLDDDFQTYGEVYLHRSHNLDGVFFCYKHKRLLKTHCPTCNTPVSPKDKYLLLSLHSTCINGHNLIDGGPIEEKSLPESELKHHLLISNIVNYLLNNNDEFKETNYGDLYDKYMYKLYKLNYLTAHGLIRQSKLKQDLISFYGPNLLNKLRLEIDNQKPYCWIINFFSKNFIASHPLKHILILIFLCNNDESEVYKFLADNSAYSLSKTKRGPWPCLNPVSDHYLRNIITDCKITISPKSKKFIGIYKCICGFTYTKAISFDDKADEDQSKDILSIKAFGQVWEDKLKNSILCEGGSLKSIARKMHCDPKTIRRYAIKLGLEFCWEVHSENHYKSSEKKPKYNLDKCKMLCEKYRNTIQGYISSFSQAPKIYQVRELYEKEYRYIYKHNKEMLINLLYPCKYNSKKAIIMNKVDWDKRDLELLPLVSNEIERLLSSDKLNRITINKIGRSLGITYILEQYIDKLPHTHALINTFTESIEEYQIRRLRIIANKLVLNGEPIYKTKLFRYAGIKYTCSDTVKNEIIRLSSINNKYN